MARALPGDSRPRSLTAVARLQNKYGRKSEEVEMAYKFFKAGYYSALDDFLDATTSGQENENWYNEEPTLQAMRRQLGLRLPKRK